MLKTIMVACAAMLLSAAGAQADDAYPARPVRIIVASAPGGGTDAVGRYVADLLSKAMGKQFYIENKPGAGNVLGTDAAAKSKPDGYTLLVTASTLTINPVMYRKLPYDSLKDFEPITQIVVMPNVLVVNPSVKATTVKEFIALAKNKPGELTYASAGKGTNPHIAMELFNSMAGVNIRHIPYRGVGPALTDVVAGRVSAMNVNILSAKPQVDGKRLRALGVTSAKRSPQLPDVPTIAESGLPGYKVEQWFGILAPAGTPQPIVAKLHDTLKTLLHSDDAKKYFAAQGAEPVGNTPDEFRTLIRDEIKTWTDVAKKAHIEPVD